MAGDGCGAALGASGAFVGVFLDGIGCCSGVEVVSGDCNAGTLGAGEMRRTARATAARKNALILIYAAGQGSWGGQLAAY